MGAHTSYTCESVSEVLEGTQVMMEDLGAAEREAGDVVGVPRKVPTVVFVLGMVELDLACGV